MAYGLVKKATTDGRVLAFGFGDIRIATTDGRVLAFGLVFIATTDVHAFG